MANKIYPVNYGDNGMIKRCLWVHECINYRGKEVCLCDVRHGTTPFGTEPLVSDIGKLVAFARMGSKEELEAVIEALRAVCDDWKE